MIRIVSVCLLVFVQASFMALPAAAADQVAGKTFFTAANIWYEKSGPIESTNYHRGSLLPVGTKVKVQEVFDGSVQRNRNALDVQIQEQYIRFETGDGTSHRIIFMERHAKKGTTVWDFFKQYFSEKDPTAEGGAFRSLPADEQKSVMAGEITEGMSKAAVLMAYGYPPSHKTPSLTADRWIYWENRFKTKIVNFSDGKVVEGPGVTSKAKKSSMDECIKACKENTTRTPEQCFDACNH